MKLDAPEGPLCVREDRGDSPLGPRQHPESGRGVFHGIAVAHPALELRRQPSGQRTVLLNPHGLAAVLTIGKGPYGAAEVGGHFLDAVANAQQRQSRIVHGLVGSGRPHLVDAPGGTGKDDALHALQVPGADRSVAGKYGRINPDLPNAAGDKLRILASEVQYQDRVHGLSLMIVWFLS